MEFIKKFNEMGGSILLVTSVFPYFKPEPYIHISTALNLPFDFNDRIDLINYIDDGRDRYISDGSLSELAWAIDDSLYEGVDQLGMYFGSAFSIGGSMENVKHTAQLEEKDGYYGVASYESGNKGKVIVLGVESWIYGSSFQTTNGSRFADNVFTYLSENTLFAIDSEFVTPENTLRSFVYTPLNNLSLTADLTLENGTKLNGFNYDHNNS